MTEETKYQYERAIEGWRLHLESYHHWMNMFAIINGALFVGMYTVLGAAEKSGSSLLAEIVPLFVCVLGTVAGWFWFFSVQGFYDWIKSWIANVQRFEGEGEHVYAGFWMLPEENRRR